MLVCFADGLTVDVMQLACVGDAHDSSCLKE